MALGAMIMADGMCATVHCDIVDYMGAEKLRAW